MPLSIVTNKNVVAVPFSPNKDISFELDGKNKGPFATMISQSLALDPSRKEEAIEAISAQFASKSTDIMKLQLAIGSGMHYLGNALDHAHHHGTQDDGNPKKHLEQLFEQLGLENAPQKEDIISAMLEQNPEKISEPLIELFTQQVIEQDVAEALEFYNKLEAVARFYKIPGPAPTFQSILAGGIIGPSFDDVSIAEAIKQDPISAAHYFYDKVQNHAAKLEITAPTQDSKLEEAEEKINEALKSTPEWATSIAESKHLNIVVTVEGGNIETLAPNFLNTTFGGAETGGLSTKEGVYMNRRFLDSQTLVAEEIIHEAEGNLSEIFSLSKPWKAALENDLATSETKLRGNLLKNSQKHLTRNSPVPIELIKNIKPAQREDAEKFFQKIPLLGSKKANVGITKNGIKEDNPHAYTEALPDLNHIALMVQARIDEKEYYKAGMTGKKYSSVDEVMSTAFPSCWKLINGSAEGNQLIQNDTGEITEIAQDGVVPKHSVVVESLKEKAAKEEKSLHEKLENASQDANQGFILPNLIEAPRKIDSQKIKNPTNEATSVISNPNHIDKNIAPETKENISKEH